MFTMSRAIRVNDGGNTDQPVLTRSQVWRGLMLKAENALPFVPRMTRCETFERGDGYLVRDIVFRGDPARERVTFYPEQKVKFERLSGNTLGSILNEIEENEKGELSLRFTFALGKEGIPAGSVQEQEYAKMIEGDYLGAVQATLNAIRQWAKEETMETTTDTSWVKDYYAAVDAMDMEKYLAFHTDDIKFRFGSAPTTVGKEAVAQGLNQLWGALESLRHQMSGVWQIGNVTIVEADITYTRKDGKVVVLPAASVLRREGNLVSDMRINMDINPLFA
jgi:ketosteroid isomerase-like protein